MSERNIITGMSGIWRNRGSWLHLGTQVNPTVAAGSVVEAARKNKIESEKKLFGIRLRIMIYQSNEEKYQSLDEIKI